jgi:hypothetical protein
MGGERKFLNMRSKLFRAQLGRGGPAVEVTNTTSRSLVIDFVFAPLAALLLQVRASGGEIHSYTFYGVLPPPLPGGQAPQPGITQLTKLIVKPGETLAMGNQGTAEVTGHYE